MNRIPQIVTFATLCGMSAAAPAWGGGLYLYEIGSPDVGLAAAGYAARAQDASTAFTNPAGMTRLEKSQVQFGAQPLYMHLKFHPDSRTDFGPEVKVIKGPLSGDDGNASAWTPTAGTFIVTPLSPDLRFGFSIAGNFGAGLDYGDDWVGRYYLKDVLMQGLTLAPALAYRINKKFSVGASLNAMYGILEETVAVNNAAVLNPSFPDGEMEIEDRTWGLGATLGVLAEPQPGTRFGATYMTKIELEFEDKPQFSGLRPLLEAALDSRGLLNATLELPLDVPQAVMVSAFHQLNDRLAIMGNLGWQDWSEFGKVDVTVSAEDTTSLTVDRNYKDTWHTALGLQYQLSDPWLLSGGIAYDSEMVDEEDLTPDLPSGASWRFGAGAQYAWSEKLKLNCAYELTWTGDLSMDVNRGPLTGRLAGEYESVALHVMVLGLNWNF
ncbi:MAG: transporter [Deltaproteobacteria bacterium]|nr:transporter [Deltaproteobacteria bacterium]